MTGDDNTMPYPPVSDVFACYYRGLKGMPLYAEDVNLSREELIAKYDAYFHRAQFGDNVPK